MARAGILKEDDRVELLDGEIVEMNPIGSRHAACINRLVALCRRELDPEIMISVQNPLRLDEKSEPIPDLMFLRKRDDYYSRSHPEPGDVLLIIEVAETSLESDRSVKIPLYARAYVPEVWLIDVCTERLEVYRNPSPQGYTEVNSHDKNAFVTPSGAPGFTVNISSLFL